VVDSYYSAPRRRTVDGSRYAFTLLRFYAFASAFASRLICKPRGFRWTMDPRLSASTAELWQFPHNWEPETWTSTSQAEKGSSASQHSLCLLKRPRSRCRYQATESGPQASSISPLDNQSLRRFTSTSPSVQPERLKRALPFPSECPRSNNGITWTGPLEQAHFMRIRAVLQHNAAMSNRSASHAGRTPRSCLRRPNSLLTASLFFSSPLSIPTSTPCSATQPKSRRKDLRCTAQTNDISAIMPGLNTGLLQRTSSAHSRSLFLSK